MARDLYRIQNDTVEPMSALLKAIVEVNYTLERADAAGWLVSLGITDDGLLQVQMTRSSWPSPSDEEPQQ